MNRHFWLCATFILSTAGEAFAQDAAAPAGSSPTLTVLYHADLDGRLATPACTQASASTTEPDYALLLGRLTSARSNDLSGSPPITLLGGNLASPELFGSALLERGPTGADVLAALLARGQYDAVAFGHHELAMPPALLTQLATALASHGLPVVATNLRCDPAARGTCPDVRPSLLLRRGNLAVGIVATISPAVVPGIPAASFKGLTLDEPVAAGRAAIRALRAQGAQLIVFMAQGPRDATSLQDIDGLARQLASGPPGERPDVIVAGGLAGEGADRPLRALYRDGMPPIAGSPAGTAGVTRIQFQVAAEPRLVAIDTLASAGATPDAGAAAVLAAELVATCARYGVAAAPGPVHGVLSREAFTTYVLEVMRRKAGAEIALINRAFVKAAPFPLTGGLTRAQLHRALPFRAVIGTARVSGATVDSALGATLGKAAVSIVGLARGPAGIEVNGRALDKVRTYKVATIAFVASGGDALVPSGAMAWRALPGAPDLRETVEGFLREHTAERDGDSSIDLRTDFGPPVATRPLVVALGDLGLDLVSTSISNGAAYTDAQLVRASQLSANGTATGLAQVRARMHEADLRLDLKYGWSRNQPIGAPITAGETADLITLAAIYNYRGLRGPAFLLKRAVPDPYVRVRVESEFTRPAVTPTQGRAYHHAQMTDTAGVMFTLLPKLRLRGGAGIQRELLASGADARWQAVLEAGGTLSPVAIATFGALAVKLEGLLDYNFVDPTGLRQHQVRGNGKLSVPLLPALFITVGVDLFAVQRQRQGWGTSADVVAGIRVHHDVAYQGL